MFIKSMKILGKIIGGILISPLALPVIAAQYGLIKTYKIIRNLESFYKVSGSFWRLICILLAGLQAAKSGMILGGMVSSLLFPAASTLAIGIIGCIAGACLGIGFGAYIGKQAGRIGSWIASFLREKRYFKSENLFPDINYTNPEKYSLNPEYAKVDDSIKVITSLENERKETFTAVELHSILSRLYHQKKENKKNISTWANISSWLASDADKAAMSRNEEFTAAIYNTRKGDVTRTIIPVSNNKPNESTEYSIKTKDLTRFFTIRSTIRNTGNSWTWSELQLPQPPAISRS